MNAKERVLTTIRHVEPDRVPLAMNATCWVRDRLRSHIGVSTDRELLQALHIDLFDMRGIDTKAGVAPRFVGPTGLGIPPDWAGDMVQLWGVAEIAVDTPGGKSYAMGAPPLEDADTIAKLTDYPWPEADWFDFSYVREQLAPWSDFAVLCSGCSVWQHPSFVRGLDVLLMDLLAAPELANFVLDKFTDFYFEYYRRMLEAAGDLIDIFWIADDFGMQNTLLFSPDVFARFLAPRIERFARMVHQRGISLLLHSDGDISPLIPRLIEIGVDILDPIQPEVTAMSPSLIKHEYGQRLCLRGGISAQEVLSNGTKQDVEAEVITRLGELAPGGGYILSPGHPVLQDDIPTENIITMYETALLKGRYSCSGANRRSTDLADLQPNT